MSVLPVDEVLPHLFDVMRRNGVAVLQAPPGAGKTSRVPLFFYNNELCQGRIMMLEPRRVAARAAADRLAQQLGEKVRQTVGYTMRGETRVSAATRIEVVTEGILTRMVQSDPELSGVGCVIFDEFHERSLHADLGLALCLEIREALRPDLKLLVMSATLDVGGVAELLGGAETIESRGQSFPVTQVYLPRPWRDPQKKVRLEDAMARLVQQAIEETEGGVLVFLPGAGEIRRVQQKLQAMEMPNLAIQPLYGALPFAAQRAAIEPMSIYRKIVLATSIAETSLTIPDIRVVVDCGLARRAAFDAGSGMSRLITVRESKAEAHQREGRAGRVAEGICYKLWTKGEEGGMAPFAPPEIESADLTNFMLEAALWGAESISGLTLLSYPGMAAEKQAKDTLCALGALDSKGRITEHGKALAAMPTHPRLAHMLATAANCGGGEVAAIVAAILENGDPLRSKGTGGSVDLADRIEFVRKVTENGKISDFKIENRKLIEDIKRFKSQAKLLGRGQLSVGALLSFAFPDRLGMQRETGGLKYLLANGKGAELPVGDALVRSRFIVAAEMDGDRRNASIRLAAEISREEIFALHANQIQTIETCEYDKKNRRVVAEKRAMLGALVLDQKVWTNVPTDVLVKAVVSGVQSEGLHVLPWTKAAEYFRARVNFLRSAGGDFPDMRDAALLDRLQSWLGPYLTGISKLSELGKVDLVAALSAQLDWPQTQALEQFAPASFTAPTGTKCAIDYAMGQPKIQVRLQEMFGLKEHPTVGQNRTPLLIELLSPARRPVQTTADLPGFWASSYADVRKDMRGRYPKHPWPEDPAQADPTRRVKSRG
ncbi:MAG TPA: ATP-dependent helicase HrpB [Paracoccaceae bacterium]|nr:ATP-dependent helicase HrpB [Paracoccaceae bacterium]